MCSDLRPADVGAGQLRPGLGVPADRLLDLVRVLPHELAERGVEQPGPQRAEHLVGAGQVGAVLLHGRAERSNTPIDADSTAVIAGATGTRPPRSGAQAIRSPSSDVGRGAANDAGSSSREIGTRGSGPAIADSCSATSATVRPIGPCTDSCDQPIGAGQVGTRPGRRAQADDVAEGGRVAQRAAHVAALGQRHEPGGQRRGRTAGGPARRQPVPVGVVGHAEDRVERVRARRELRHVRLADPDRAGRLQPRHHQLVASGTVFGVQRRAPRRPHAAGGVGVLVRDGQAVQRADRTPRGQRRVGGVGGGPRALGVQRDDGVDLRVELLDAVQVGLEQLARGDLAVAEQRGELGRGPDAEVVVDGGHAPSLSCMPRPDEPDCARFGRQGTMGVMDEERATSTDTAGDGVTFEDLGLRPELLEALTALGYEEPTPIQQEAIPPLVEGRDLLGQAATGTGKTAAFALPVLQRLAAHRRERPPVALVLVPTRELAVQVSEALHRYGKDLGARVLPVYGGAPIVRQLRALESGVDVVVATPGRALDLLHRGSLHLGEVATVVLDEADEMLDMGFAEDLEAILGETPAERQTVLFSATMPRRLDSPGPPAPAATRSGSPSAARRSAAGEAPRVRQTAYVVPRAAKPAALGRILDVEAPTAAHRLLPHPRGGRHAHRDPQRPRLPGRGAARRHEPGAARPGDGPAPRRDGGPAGRHRRRRARPGHRPAHPRRQLRRPVGAGVLRAPHRPGGPGRPRGRGDHAGRAARAPAAQDHRAGRRRADRRREGADGRRPARPPAGAHPRRAAREPAHRRPRPLPRRRRDAHRRVRRRRGRPGRGQAGARGRRRRATTTRRSRGSPSGRSATPAGSGRRPAGAGGDGPRPRARGPSGPGARLFDRCRPRRRDPPGRPRRRDHRRDRPDRQGRRRRSRSTSGSPWSRCPSRPRTRWSGR